MVTDLWLGEEPHFHSPESGSVLQCSFPLTFWLILWFSLGTRVLSRAVSALLFPKPPAQRGVAPVGLWSLPLRLAPHEPGSASGEPWAVPRCVSPWQGSWLLLQDRCFFGRQRRPSVETH